MKLKNVLVNGIDLVGSYLFYELQGKQMFLRLLWLKNGTINLTFYEWTVNLMISGIKVHLHQLFLTTTGSSVRARW